MIGNIFVATLCSKLPHDTCIVLLLQSNFKQLLNEMGRKGFVEQLTMVLHQVSILVCAVLYQVMTYLH